MKIAVAIGILLILGLIGWGIYTAVKKNKEQKAAAEQAANTKEQTFPENTKASVPKDAEIAEAIYGTNEKNVDVTEVVKKLVAASGDGSFDVNNTTMGVDPAYGSAKVLTVRWLPKAA